MLFFPGKLLNNSQQNCILLLQQQTLFIYTQISHLLIAQTNIQSNSLKIDLLANIAKISVGNQEIIVHTPYITNLHSFINSRSVPEIHYQCKYDAKNVYIVFQQELFNISLPNFLFSISYSRFTFSVNGSQLQIISSNQLFSCIFENQESADEVFALLLFAKKLKIILQLLDLSNKNSKSNIQGLQPTIKSNVIELSEESSLNDYREILDFQPLKRHIKADIQQIKQLKIKVEEDEKDINPTKLQNDELNQKIFDEACKKIMKGLHCQNSRKKSVFLVITVQNKITIAKRKGCGNSSPQTVLNMTQAQNKKDLYALTIAYETNKPETFYAPESEILRLLTTFNVIQSGFQNNLTFKSWE